MTNCWTVTLWRQCYQAHRERGVGGGLATRGPATFGGPTISEKYKVHQNVPFWNKKFKFFFPDWPYENVWGPHKNVSPSPAVALDGPECYITTSKEYLTNSHILLKYFELVFFQLYLVKISCELITIWLELWKKKKKEERKRVPFFMKHHVMRISYFTADVMPAVVDWVHLSTTQITCQLIRWSAYRSLPCVSRIAWLLLKYDSPIPWRQQAVN